MEMIRALTLVWLFAGIRGDEIRRLRVGCVRWQQDNASSVCFLDVPVNKTGTAFTKPVDALVGQAINAWEKVRRPQAKLCDHKTGEMVDFLFLHRMRPLGEYFLNLGLIPKALSEGRSAAERPSGTNYKSSCAVHYRHTVVQRQGADEPVRAARVARGSPAAPHATIRADSPTQDDSVVFLCWLFLRKLH